MYAGIVRFKRGRSTNARRYTQITKRRLATKRAYPESSFLPSTSLSPLPNASYHHTSHSHLLSLHDATEFIHSELAVRQRKKNRSDRACYQEYRIVLGIKEDDKLNSISDGEEFTEEQIRRNATGNQGNKSEADL